MGPNAAINQRSYKARRQHGERLHGAAQHRVTIESPEPVGWGVIEGLGDLRFPLCASPVSSEGWVVWVEVAVVVGAAD